MIEIHAIDGINCPILICDVCGERIQDASKAAIVFDNFQPNGSRVKALSVHKGNIDGKTCHHEAELIIASGGGRAGWEELKAALTDLSSNVGFPASEMAKYDANRKRSAE